MQQGLWSFKNHQFSKCHVNIQLKLNSLESSISLFTEQEMASNVNVDLVINELNNLSHRHMF